MPPPKVDDDDPVTAEYDVFITPALQEQLHLLQFPMRLNNRYYDEASGNKPLQMRLKPDSSYVELDVPVQTAINYDEPKARTWGSALNKGKSEGVSGYGMAVGFAPGAGVRAQQQKASKEAHRAEREDDGDAASRIMHQHTLGGQAHPAEVDSPFLMLGVFRDDQLHLTRVDDTTTMRPQFHYIDAKLQDDRNKTRRERETSENVRPLEPRSVQMALKPVEGERADQSKAHHHANTARQENWRKLQFHDQEAHEAYEAYHEKLFVQDPIALAVDLVTSTENQQFLDSVTPVTHQSRRAKQKPPAKRSKAPIDVTADVEHEAHDQEDVQMTEATATTT